MKGKFNVEAPTSVKTSALQFQLGPNPAQEFLNLPIISKIGTATVYTLDGKLAQRQEVQTGQTTLPVQDLRAGAYLLYLEGRRYKFIKE